jgi:hypothetical protein
MALSQQSRCFSSFSLAVAVAVPLWLGAAKQAPAQSTPAITPGTRNFQATMILQANLQQGANAQRQAVIAPAYQRPHRTGPAVRFSAAAPLTIVISTPPASPLDPRQPTEYANIRGPGGDVRRIPLARGKDTIQPRSIIVRAGESVTLQIMAAAPPAKPRSR